MSSGAEKLSADRSRRDLSEYGLKIAIAPRKSIEIAKIRFDKFSNFSIKNFDVFFLLKAPLRISKSFGCVGFQPQVLGPRYCFSPDNVAHAGGRNADRGLRVANSPRSRAAGEGVAGGVNPSPRSVVWGLELVGGVDGTADRLNALRPKASAD